MGFFPTADVPESDSFVVASADKAVPFEDECGAEVGVAAKETDGLGKAKREVAFSVMK